MLERAILLPHGMIMARLLLNLGVYLYQMNYGQLIIVNSTCHDVADTILFNIHDTCIEINQADCILCTNVFGGGILLAYRT